MDDKYLVAQRKGRFSEIASWQEQYNKKLTNAQAVADLLRDGDRLSLVGSANIPQAFDKAMMETALAKGFQNLNIYSCCPLKEHEYMKAEYSHIVNIFDQFLGEDRHCAKNGNLNYVPLHLSRLGQMLEYFAPRMVVTGVTPPDENGWMSRSIWGSDINRAALTAPTCEVIAVEVNKNLPYLCGGGPEHLRIHVSEVDYIIENDYEWPEIKSAPTTETESMLAGYIAEMIDDGSCIQIGYGSLADAIGANLVSAGKKDLGLHTEVMTNCVANLMKEGVINNSRKTFHKGKSLASQVTGDKQLWDFVHNNEDCEFLEFGYINDIRNIIKNQRVVSINNAIEIDLTGQVASEAIGTFQYSGTGGQLEWVIGSQLSKGGKSIIVLQSSFVDKKGVRRSKIRPTLPLGAFVTTPRAYTQYVITEFGVADMKFKTVRQRAEQLIKIAHPDFREELRFEAKKTGWM